MGAENNLLKDIHDIIDCQNLLKNNLIVLSMDYISYIKENKGVIVNKNNVINAIEKSSSLIDSAIKDVVYKVTAPLISGDDCDKNDVSDLKSLAAYEANR